MQWKDVEGPVPKRIHYSDAEREAWFNDVMWSIDPNRLVTFNFNGPTSPWAAQKAIKKWHEHSDMKILGPQYADAKFKLHRTVGIGVFEHKETNLHVHMPLRAASISDSRSDSDIDQIYKKQWIKRIPSGVLHIQPADRMTRARMLHYLTKEAWRSEFFEEIIVL